jgi:8-oxo-dGTP pyrophosphatase MutT (NUDIX family)
MDGMDAPDAVLAALSRLLPRIAEEGGDAEAVAEAKLGDALAKAASIGPEQAEITVALVRRCLQALAVLEPRRLAEGEWQFASFPASLLAHSLLSGLGAPDFRLLESGFWDASDYRIDAQRSLIKRSEELRASQQPAGLVPIRRVWVAWAFIALDGRFLLVRREDPAQHRIGSRGQFVFPGGRASPQDLPDLSLAARLDFFDPQKKPDDTVVAEAFANALHRELHEELEISASELASAVSAQDPIHYAALEGGKSAYSATEYLLQPFKIELTDAGKTSLLRCLAAHPERFDWFTPEELATGLNAKGSKAFVDAIGNASLDAAKFSISIGAKPSFKDAITLPGNTEEPFSVGVTGREKPVHAALDVDEINTLNWLAAVRRNEPVDELTDGISVAIGSGWVLVDYDSQFAKLKQLAEKLEDAGLSLLDFHERAVRLNADGEIHYSPFRFSFDIQDEKRGKAYKLTLHRREIRSPLGVATERQTTTSLPEKLGAAIYSLLQGDPGPALDDFDTVKRMQRDIRDALEPIGLRVLIRQVDGVPELTVRGELAPKCTGS